MKSQMTIGKLLVSVGAVLLMSVAQGLTSLNSSSEINASLENATKSTARRVSLVGQIDAAGSSMLAGQRGLLMYSFAKAPAGVERSKALVNTAGTRWQKALRYSDYALAS